MRWQALLWLAILGLVPASGDLALVRAFASTREVDGLQNAFELWAEVAPCANTPAASVDLILVYSQSLDANADAANATRAVQDIFDAASWQRCFRSLQVFSANLTEQEDIYDSRGYTVRKDWVNGPNSVFRYVLGSFYDGGFGNGSNATYDAFYFMELDAVPIKSNWLDQFILEALHYPRAAVRGSLYRGDSWDAFERRLPEELLRHINGNAIYNLQHPWLQWLYGQLILEQDTEYNSVAFDLRMASLSLQGKAGVEPYSAAYAERVPADEDAYLADSMLIGNYANTLLNSSFEAGVFVRHGSLDNIFEDLDGAKVTLGVSNFGSSSFDTTWRSFNFSHPFRTILVLSYGESAWPNGTEVLETVRGPSQINSSTGSGPIHLAFCEMAAQVSTEFFVYTDEFHFLASPVYILHSAGSPVLPYIHASSNDCVSRNECHLSLQQAETLFGVSLNYHHDLFETVFITDLAQQFCSAWELATTSLPDYEDCGVQFGPTADDYFAWQISVGQQLQYVPKDKEKVGFRAFSKLWKPTPVDARVCAVYTQQQYDQMLSNISQCSLVLDGSLCEEAGNCTFRPIFESGRCIDTPRYTPSWLAPSYSTTSSTTSTSATGTTSVTATSATDTSTTTGTATSTTTGTGTATSTSTSSSSRSTSISSTSSSITTSTSLTSTSVTSSSLTITSTSSVSTTLTTSSRTSSLTSATQTSTSTSQTTTSGTYTVLAGSCPLPILDSAIDVTDCLGKFPGETCQAFCSPGYVGAPSTYSCTTGEVFTGQAPVCQTTTSSTTATTTVTELVLCGGGIPTGLGVDASGCADRYNGQSCNASCIQPYEGGPVEYVCDPAQAAMVPVGDPLLCKKPECQVSQLPSNVSSSDCVGRTVGEFCVVSCLPGYTGQEEFFECLPSQLFTGTAPVCEALPCAGGNLPVIPGVSISDCLGLFAGSSCSVACSFGFEGAAAAYVCDLLGAFSGSPPTCVPKSCPLPAELLGNISFNSSCEGATHGQSCLTECNPGFTGLPTQHRCWDGVLEGSAPSCTALPCGEGIPLSVGLDASDCDGRVSYETCTLGCDAGYELRGSPVLTCQSATSTFSATDAVCDPGQCSNLSSVPPFAGPRVADSCSALAFSEACFAFCEQGYQLEGDASSMRCAALGAAVGFVELLAGQTPIAAENSTGPNCSAKPCTHGFPNLRGGVSDCLGKATEETCTISAELGFTLTGPPTVTCQADGSFSKTTALVEPAVCADPDFGVEGVGSTCTNKTVGEDCWAYCTRGFTGLPQPYRCQANQSANAVLIEQLADTVSCVNSSLLNATTTSTTTTVAGGRRLQTAACFGASVATAGLGDQSFLTDCSGKVHDDACVAHCSQGWNMTETAPSIFLCDNGFLVGAALPTCTPLPCSYSFPDGPGVEHNCDGVRSAETCTATCTAVGYTYSSGNSAATFTCQPTGSFTGDTPTCERVQCSDLSLGASFQHTCRGQRYEDTCSVGCAKGYSLVGTSGQFTCQANQSFTGALPTCTGNPCNQPRSNAALNTTGCNSVTTSETCEVTCQPGFEPNTSSLTCDATGYLLGAAPSCKPSQCPTHSALQDPTLRSNCAGVTYGSRCAVFCAPGHSSNGSAAEEWRCDLSGGSLGLQGVAPVCEPQACTSGLPAGDSSVSSNCSNLKTGETCVQNCAFGYSSTAPTSAYTCSEDGTASGSSAACQPVSCDHALSVTGLDHTCAGVVFGGHCFTMCAAGYNATGTKYQRLLCEGVSAGSLVPGLTETNGVGLRGSLPSCEPLPCLYNLPVGGVYDHNCDGVKTGESCVVSCAAGFWGTPQTLQCDGTSSLTGSMPSCAVATSTVTVTTVTATSTTTVTTQPFLCTSAFLPSIEGASNFSCAGDPGVGQICRSPCDDVMSADVQAVVICWTDQRWRVSEACLSAASSQQLTVIFVVTLSVLCTVMLLSGGVLYVLGGGGSGGVKIHPKVEPPPSFEPKEAPPGGAEPLKEPPPPKSDDQQLLADYSWSRRPVHPVDMDFMCAESFLQPGQLVARPPALPMAFTTRGQPSAGLSQLDEMFAGPEPPQLQSLRQTAVVQVEEDASFRVWVQHLPPDTSSYQAGETA